MGSGINILRIHNAEFYHFSLFRSLQNNNLEKSAIKEDPDPTTAPVEVLHTTDSPENMQGKYFFFLRDFYLRHLSSVIRGAGKSYPGIEDVGKEYGSLNLINK